MRSLRSRSFERKHKAKGLFNIWFFSKIEKNWEAIKQKEKNRKSILEGVPLELPSLSRAQRFQEKAAFSGFE